MGVGGCVDSPLQWGSDPGRRAASLPVLTTQVHVSAPLR